MERGADRVIFHCDCNAFYASVEELLHPGLRQVPMAVCGNPESRRGVILAKNERAKAAGVQTAETVWQARQKCPDLVLAPARHHLYREYCERINAVYADYTDQVERFGIDESFLDVTGSLHLFGGDAEMLAHAIRERIKREIGVTISVGVSFNKVFAKLGSDYRKPDAVTVFSRENYRDLVWQLPVSSLLLVGKATEQALAGMMIRTIGDLARADAGMLRQRLGKVGEVLHTYAAGQDDSPVLHLGETQDLQSVGNGITFKRDLVTREDIRTGITALADSVAARLRRAGVKCMTVQVTIKDTSLQIMTRQKGTPSPTYLARDIAAAAMELVEASWRIGAPIRMLTVTASRLVPADSAPEQLTLFDGGAQGEGRARRERLEKAVDRIRERYGKESISPGSVVHNDLGIGEHFGQQQEPEQK